MTKEGNSPVNEKMRTSWMCSQVPWDIRACGNSGGPSPKAKYSLATDSELVP